MSTKATLNETRGPTRASREQAPPTSAPLGPGWREHIERLDQQLLTLRDRLLKVQKQRCEQRNKERKNEADRHKARCALALSAISGEVQLAIYDHAEHKDLLSRIEEKLAALMDLLEHSPHIVGSDADPSDVRKSLEDAINYPRLFLRDLLSDHLKVLGGSHLEQPKLEDPSPAAEEIAWAHLELQVLAVAAAPAQESAAVARETFVEGGGADDELCGGGGRGGDSILDNRY